MEITVGPRMREVFSDGGIAHAEVSLSLPRAEGEGRGAAAINAFYARIGEGALEIGRSLLLPRARARYEASDDPRRRFTHRPYRLELTAVCTSCEEGTEVRRTLALYHRGRRLYSEAVTELITTEGRIFEKKAPRVKKRNKKG
ncbi:MAG: hypothetical protein IKC73_00605 [Clostridia bacterium]|nr:hypothetical protein [Clostridia bacterium]